MIAAIIAGGVVVVALISFAWWAIATVREGERRCADARVDASSKAGQLAIAASDIATHKARGDREKERADALDQELESVAIDGDAAGARDRVLRRQARTEGTTDTTGGGDAGLVPVGGPDPAVASRSDDDLMAPGE